MRGLTPEIICIAAGGTAAGMLPAGEITAIVTDSRQVVPGCLFAAIPGARVDGHDFVERAAEMGAVCAIVNHKVSCSLPQIIVPDTQSALGKIAGWYRRQFSIPFVGITGSVGKTTAKEMTAAVLSTAMETLRTEKNFNNELGVPFTLFRLRDEHRAAVVEMGISGFGEMTRLTAMVRPDIAVFTVIGDAHLEFLGSREGVLRAKSEIVNGMSQNGVVIVNGDDPLLAKHDFGRRTILCGVNKDCDVQATDIESVGLESMRCVIVSGERRIPVNIPAFGRHLITAALLAAAVGMELGVSDEDIARGIENYEIVGSRGNFIRTDDVTILNDCYNANPTSVASSLQTLAAMPGRHVAILGDMRELGESSAQLHRDTGRKAVESGAVVVTCGPEAKAIAEGADAKNLHFDNIDTLIEALPEILRKGDSVLVKASHAMNFDKITEALQKLKLS